jgi:3-dehydroquinate synthase class II
VQLFPSLTLFPIIIPIGCGKIVFFLFKILKLIDIWFDKKSLIDLNRIKHEIKSFIDSLDENVNDEFIHSLKIIFENYYINTLKQALLLKPYKVVTKNEETKIAYNEREWRKSFFDLNFIYEIKPDGTKNEEYIQWNKKNKPHYTEKYIQSFDLSDVISIYVNEDAEIIEMEKFITENFNEKIEIYTLQQLKEIENKKISANNYHFSKT